MVIYKVKNMWHLKYILESAYMEQHVYFLDLDQQQIAFMAAVSQKCLKGQVYEGYALVESNYSLAVKTTH